MQACSNPAGGDNDERLLATSLAPPNAAAYEPHSSSSHERMLSVTPLHDASQLEDTPPAHQQLSVRDAFAGRTVLLTGVTGFVGSLVLEQLLRTCPEIAKIYVIVRQKHGISGQDRFHKMLNTNPLFHLLRCTLRLPCCAGGAGHNAVLLEDARNDDGVLELARGNTPHIEAIAGNMTLPDYGIAQADLLRLQQQTEIVIHAAASISFDDHIHDAITHNYMVSSVCRGIITCMTACLSQTQKRKEKTTPFGVKLLRSPVLYWAAQSDTHISAPFVHVLVAYILFSADANDVKKTQW